MIDLLISAEQLKAKKNCLVFDCTFSMTHPLAGRRQYLLGHIPGAQYVALDQDLSAKPGAGGRHPLPEREKFAEKLRFWGTNKESTIVCYDQNVSAYATRMWWIARWLGHKNVHVLNGGLNAWIAAGFPTETALPKRKQGNFAAGQPLTRACEASDLIDSRSTLLDAREKKRFLGQEEPIDSVAGHIPGAISAPSTENLKNGYFLTKEELILRFSEMLAINEPDHKVICYCGSGVTATHNIFAMMLAGFKEPTLYPGSWSDWITDPDRPIAKGP